MRTSLEAIESAQVELDQELKKRCTFRIGGPAQYLVTVAEEAAVGQVLATAHRFSVPIHFLGQGSNVLFPDQGLPGVVLRFAGALAQYQRDGALVVAGAGVSLAQLANKCAREGYLGLEALSGFPSSVGGRW